MRHHRRIIYLAGFLFSLPIALTTYINSSFLEVYVNKYYISLLYVIASIITIVGLTEMPKILTRFGNRKTVLTLTLIAFFSLITLGTSANAPMAVISFILYLSSFNLIFFSLDIFIEDFSKNSETGSIRGMYLTIANSAWILSQVISGSIIAKSAFQGIYFLSALFTILASTIFILFMHDFIDPKYKKVSIIKISISFIKNRNISRIYLINLVLKFFYAWMIIYAPIYLHQHLDFTWSQIGIIFSIMLLPFVILEYPLGKLSDKIGEKKMLLIGFAIMSISTLTIPLVKINILWLWAGILFLTRVGAATVDVMCESYFFKSVDKENAGLISFFRNTSPLSYIIAPILAIPILFFVPSFKYIFFVLGAVTLGGLLISARLKDIK